MKACDCCWLVGDGPGYMAMCPCDGFTDVGHGGGPQPSLVVVPWETTVVLREVLPPRLLCPLPVAVAAVTVDKAAAVVLARRRQWSEQRFVGVERRWSSSWIGGVQMDFLHHGIRLDVEVGDDGVDVR
jgi:hypothetical protein